MRGIHSLGWWLVFFSCFVAHADPVRVRLGMVECAENSAHLMADYTFRFYDVPAFSVLPELASQRSRLPQQGAYPIAMASVLMPPMSRSVDLKEVILTSSGPHFRSSFRFMIAGRSASLVIEPWWHLQARATLIGADRTRTLRCEFFLTGLY